jgi:hypothetical protein
MALSYRNLSRNKILNTLRDIRYLNGAMVFGFYNTTSVNLTLTLDPEHIFTQADIFSRQMYEYRSFYDLKRFLGSYQEDWFRIMSEAYVYDRLKAIFYGIYSTYMLKLPDNLVTFPGHALLVRLLADRNYIFHIDEEQSFTYYVNLKVEKTFEELANPIFEICPDLKDGLHINNTGSYVYCNPFYEAVLHGFHRGSIYLENNNVSKVKGKTKVSESFFQMCMIDDDNILNFIKEDTFPIANSFLNKSLNKFYFLRNTETQNIEAPKFDESTFISRALGFTGDQLTIEGNDIYNVANSNVRDIFARDEVYSITGMRSNILPHSLEQIDAYLGINHWNPPMKRKNLKDINLEEESTTP